MLFFCIFFIFFQVSSAPIKDLSNYDDSILEQEDILEEDEIYGDETFAKRLAKMDIPDKFKLNEIVIGKESAPIKLIIYSSFSCMYCREFHKNDFPKFKKQYIDTGKVKVYLRCYLEDQGTLEAAQILRCLGTESVDKYMSLYSKVYDKQIEWMNSNDPAEFLKNIFISRGFKKENVESCLTRTDISAGLMLEQKNAMYQSNVISVPAFSVNDKTYIGNISYKELEEICGL